jgi:hypothetical protein
MAQIKSGLTIKRVVNPLTFLTMALLLAILVSGMMGVAVLADAPAVGGVVEGESTPGITLGVTTRAQVEAVYGAPRWCQDTELGGDRAYCSYAAAGGGGIGVRYQGPDGRYASNSPDDVTYLVRWSQQVSGWVTTVGISTALAFEDRQAVADAYPNAEVTYDGLGQINSVEDPGLGIRVKWSYDSYTHSTSVYMATYIPPASLSEGSSIRVSDIDLVAQKYRGERHITAVVSVQGEQGQPVSGAKVTVTWTYPFGATQTVWNDTSHTGYAFFERVDARRGTWTLTVEDVELAGHPFDRASSLLNASIKVK